MSIYDKSFAELLKILIAAIFLNCTKKEPGWNKCAFKRIYKNWHPMKRFVKVNAISFLWQTINICRNPIAISQTNQYSAMKKFCTAIGSFGLTAAIILAGEKYFSIFQHYLISNA